MPSSDLHPQYKYDEFRVAHLTPRTRGSVASILGDLGIGTWSDDEDDDDDDDEAREEEGGGGGGGGGGERDEEERTPGECIAPTAQ